MRQSLTVAQVAAIRGTDRTAAYRWLQSHARRYLRRRGRLLVIPARVFAVLHDPPLDCELLRRFERIEEESAEHARRLDAHARALIHLHAL